MKTIHLVLWFLIYMFRYIDVYVHIGMDEHICINIYGYMSSDSF